MDKSDRLVRDHIYEVYEAIHELKALMNTNQPDLDVVQIPRNKLSRFLSVTAFAIGYAMAVMPLVPASTKPRGKRREKALQYADPKLCCEALTLMLDHVDYTSQRCTFTEQIGAVLPVEVIYQARVALNAYKQLRENRDESS
jgi:hypothetical protein